MLVDEAPPQAAPLCALVAFLAALDDDAVPYCVWKSNSHLAAALRGETDVDLLVDRALASSFRRIVAAHDIKSLVSPPSEVLPGTEHYLGFDDVSGRMFHLHVHYELVVGQKHVKNHRIPMEHSMLSSTRRLGGIRTPSAEFELAILAVRALLKYRARDVVKDVLHIRSPGVPEEFRLEVEWLLDQVTIADVRSALHRSGNVIPASIVEEFVTRLTEAPRSGMAFLRLRTRLRRALRPNERRTRRAAHVTYARALVRKRPWLKRVRDTRLMPTTGGRSIAVVGPDGSGKSTTARALEDWLGWKLQTSRYYLGSKQPSLRSRVLYLLFRILRRTHRTLTKSRAFYPMAVVVASTRDVTLAFHFVSIARDRARRVSGGRRDVGVGKTVIFDRYPVRHLSAEPQHQIFDGPHIALALGPTRSRLVRRLAAREDRAYASFPPPDQLIFLRIDPDVAMARKPDHEADVIRTKVCVAEDLFAIATEHPSTEVSRVDANRALDVVLGDLKAAVWRGL